MRFIELPNGDIINVAAITRIELFDPSAEQDDMPYDPSVIIHLGTDRSVVEFQTMEETTEWMRRFAQECQK